MTDPIEPGKEYTALGERFEQIIAHVERLVAVIQKGANSLQRWRSVYFDNVDVKQSPGMVDVPPEIDAKDWPSAEQLAKAIAEYRHTKHALEKVWAEFPESEQRVRKAPDVLDTSI